MCGVLGVITRSPSTMVQGSFTRALDLLRHRGPDAKGEYRNGPVYFGHRRLSILDLSDAGNQPMRSADGRFAVTYNGEIYNFRELASQAQLRGLRSGSDTEVLLRMFELHGVASFTMLNGMYAFAVHDAVAQKVWLVRDRLGIKPLYYVVDEQSLAFASEIKSILSLRDERPVCDAIGLHEWLYFGNALGGRTLYHGIQQLLPGHYLELDLRSLKHRTFQYWSVEKAAEKGAGNQSMQDAARVTRELLEAAVQRQLASDVPLGLFLSGGIDSAAIAAFAARHYGPGLSTYTAGFDFCVGENELPRARRIAKLYGTRHHELHISGGAIAEVMQRLVHHHDTPFADAANIPLHLLASEISGYTKVVLQGDGGDELFGGYSRYVTVSHHGWMSMLARLVLPLHGLLGESALHGRLRRYLRALATQDPGKMAGLLLTPEDAVLHPESIFAAPLRARILSSDPFARHRECLRRFGNADAVNRMSFLDLSITLPDTFLEKVDRATMAASLEVRVPFLDHDLVDFAVSLPGRIKNPRGRKKALLKMALRGIVPDEVLDGPKIGLSVPYDKWLQGPLKPLFFDLLETCSRKYPDVLDTGRIRALHARTSSGGRDDSYMLWKVLNLMLWVTAGDISFAEPSNRLMGGRSVAAASATC